MKLTPLPIEGSWYGESPSIKDERGYFQEWFKSDEILRDTGVDFYTKQGNVSKSKKDVIRGIHFSMAPQGQDKWVTCLEGCITDVIVDTRVDSPTFGEFVIIELDSKIGNSVLISGKLGHAFVSKTDIALVAYLTSTSFSPEYEFQINPFDSEIGIPWGIDVNAAILSEKDKAAPTLNELRLSQKLPSSGMTRM